MIKQVIHANVIMISNLKGLCFLYLLLTIINAVVTPLNILLSERLINNIIISFEGDIFWQPIIISGALLALCMIYIALQSWLMGLLNIVFERKMICIFMPKIIKKMQKLEYSCFENNEYLDVMARLGNEPYNQLRDIFISTMSVIQTIVSILLLGIIYMRVSILLILILLLVIAPTIYINYKIGRVWFNLDDKQVNDLRKMSYLRSLLSDKNPLLELKVFSAIPYMKKKWEKKVNLLVNERLKTHINVQKLLFIKNLLSSTWYTFSLFLMCVSLINMKIEIGLFISILPSLAGCLVNIDSLAGTLQSISQNVMMVDHYDFFNDMPEYQEKNIKFNLKNPVIRFESVSFTYPGTETEVLKNVSFEMDSKQSTAIVGKNGSGKSTVVKLLCKLYAPCKGKITINGNDLNDISYSQLKDIFSIVIQDFNKYQLTLRENILFGNIDGESEDSELINALKKGMLDELLEHGLDRNLGKIEDDGIDLSGGQWQKIAIARTFLSKSEFIILDEPTASLDPISESNLYTSFSEIQKDKGVLMISHRLASSKMADRIIVLNNGTIEEEGTHNQLIEKRNLYYEMFSSQSSWYIDEVIK